MQADLFQVSSAPTAASNVTAAPKESFLDKFRISLRLDHALLILISLVLVYVVIFSFGFEKGKRSAARDFERREAVKTSSLLSQMPRAEVVMIDATRLPAAQTTAMNPVEPQAALGAVPAAVPAAEAVSSVPAAGKGKYTIQLVTYRTQAEADKLIQKLAGEGYRGFSMTQGSYRLVFVNDFETRSTANTALSKLKTDGLAPADAYVRNMPKLS